MVAQWHRSAYNTCGDSNCWWQHRLCQPQWLRPQSRYQKPAAQQWCDQCLTAPCESSQQQDNAEAIQEFTESKQTCTNTCHMPRILRNMHKHTHQHITFGASTHTRTTMQWSRNIWVVLSWLGPYQKSANQNQCQPKTMSTKNICTQDTNFGLWWLQEIVVTTLGPNPRFA